MTKVLSIAFIFLCSCLISNKSVYRSEFNKYRDSSEKYYHLWHDSIPRTIHNFNLWNRYTEYQTYYWHKLYPNDAHGKIRKPR